MRSKPASNSSPATGAGRPDSEADADAADRDEPGDAKPDAKVDAKPDAKPGKKSSKRSGDVAIELEASRQRSLSWTVAGGLIGCLLIWKLGTVGVWGGFVLVAIAVYNAWNLAQTFLYPPGTIVVTEREVSLPRGLSMPRPVKATRADVTAVYFLRRSVPWNHAAPVLIIELGDKAMAFPRDWFASEADQRHIVHALLRDKVKLADAEPDDKAADKAADKTAGKAPAA